MAIDEAEPEGTSPGSRWSAGPFRTLRRRHFRRFFIAVTIVGIGQFLQTLAAPFLVNELTDSNAWVGAAGFAVLFPAVLTTPVAGILSDRLDRRRLLLVAYSVQGVVTGSFALLYAAGALTPWRILGLLVVSGAAAGFQWPPIQTISAVLVPEDELVDAVRVVSMSFTAGRALGPALAAVILAGAGPGMAFVGTFVCVVAGIVALVPVRTRTATGRDEEPFLSQLRAGVAYVRARPGVRLAVRLSFVTAALGATFSFSLAPSVADDLYRTGGGGLGALTAMIGVGSAVSSVYISGRGGRVRRSRITLVSIGLYGLALLVVAATDVLVIGLAGYALMGVAHMLHGVSLNTSLQVQVEDEYRGRVLSVWLISLLSGLPLGAVVGGALAEVWSIRAVLVLYAVGLLTSLALNAWRTRGLRLLDDHLPEYG